MAARMLSAGGLLLAVLAASVAAEAATAKVTPVEKVIELLKKLDKQVEEEGKKEAAEYDKYACFCKEQASDKLYAIEKSTKKIADLTAAIDKLTSEITALDTEISDLASTISELEMEIRNAENQREKEHDAYKVDAADMAGAIAACKGAIEALKDSKGAMEGKTDKEALVQVRAVAALALGQNMGQRNTLTQQQWNMLSNIANQPGEAYQYEYHSNDIISTLESLLKTFTENKNELDQEEFEINSAFEKKRLGLQNEKKFAEKEKAEKEAVVEEKTEKKNAAEEARTQESNEKTSDQSFLDVLTEECETKAGLWDQRSKARADELKAISEAMTALEEGVAPNYKANKKLVALNQNKVQAPKGHWEYVEDKAPAKKGPSFLQIRRSSDVNKREVEKVASFLVEQASSLKSPMLSAMALKVRAAEDHFVKVRGLIKDLITRLEAEAADEATQKSECDEDMALATTARDEAQSTVESKTADITALEAANKKLVEDIAQLSKEIAENKKALNEATELRAEESAENEKTVAEAGAGKDAVEMALNVLKDFYEPRAFVQYVPPNSDREGNTVADLAPETFDSEYKGSQDASKGIVGMLEVILSDFERTVTTVTEEESDAQGEFDTFKQENEADTNLKEKIKKDKEGEIADNKDSITQLQDDLKQAEDKLENALKELETLHSMCVAAEETYEERVAKRKKEIEALKEAHDILENWQG